jgi:predicted 3-demethylubiquinone-9 3-methyltransferase (glyoxalase superfamily)
MSRTQKIKPFLWFNNNLEEAIAFYQEVFSEVQVHSVNPMSAEFSIFDQEFIGLNGGPNFSFTEAISFFISCADQGEIDYYWDALTKDGGSEGRCGWLQDKFGLSWQVVPTELGTHLGNPDPEKSAYAMQAMMGMNKFVIADLYSGDLE